MRRFLASSTSTFSARAFYAVTSYDPEMGNITALKSESKVVVVDFSAEWCGPCKAAAPQYLAMSETHPTVGFYKVDVDECSDAAAEFNVRSVPTFIVFKDGKQVERVEGAAMASVDTAIQNAKK